MEISFAAASYLIGVGIIIYLIFVLAMWQIFYKAGEDGWKSLIPVYNTYILLKIAQQPTWMLLLFFIPVLNVVAGVLLAFALAKVFDKTPLFAVVGLVLFPYFGYMMLGWGDAEYNAAGLVE